ncbi:MAG: SDR family oxidoreductase [Dermatophilus congolensis]|nr:SDR family oxidoreductase [Dermatophilus congolensis]
MPDQFATRRSRYVLLTGATGFLGTALLEALLRRTQARVAVLVRPTSRASAHDRVRELVRSEAFEPLRAEFGLLAETALLSRIDVIPGDLSSLDAPHGPTSARLALPRGIDTVIHSASSVNFDDPLSAAFAANVEGPAALYRALVEAGGSPHVIHVSTTYVNAGRVRVGREDSVRHDVDWRLELVANDATLANDATAGRRHARRYGWTDTYTFSKALGERVAEEEWGRRGHRLTVLRPAIIESAVQRPFPGWLDGFKVADPLIAAYAEGQLDSFPGRARGAIDIVPVDAVVDTAFAAMSRPPLSGRPRYLQVATSRANPLRLRDIRPRVAAALDAHGWPNAEARGRTVRYRSELTIRAGLHVARAQLLAQYAMRGAGGVGRRRRRALDRLSKFVTLYAPYTCNPTTFDMTGTGALLEAYRNGGGRAVDVTTLDWDHYLTDVHVPALGVQRKWWPDSAVVAVTAQARAVSRVTNRHVRTEPIEIRTPATLAG